MLHPLAEALSNAIRELRDELENPAAAIAIVAPTGPNSDMCRRTLATAGAWFNVHFYSPERLVAELATLRLGGQGLQPEPTGWLDATIAAELPSRVQAFGDVAELLQRPGWATELGRVAATFESEGIDAALLRSLDVASVDVVHRDVAAAALELVADARRADRLWGAAEQTEAARAAVDTGAAVPPNRIAGVVVLGDRALPFGVYDVLSRWLGQRPYRRIETDAMHAIADAPLGFRRAAPAPPTVVRRAEETALARLGRGLWGSLGATVPLDESLTLVATPDQTREPEEVARAVVAEARRGTPLNRIGVAVPDADAIDALQAAFARADIPAVWLVGPPIAQGPAAGFLSLCLRIALGGGTRAEWYALLRTPGLLSRGPFAGIATAGRSRWRRLLRDCGAWRDAESILTALAHSAETTSDETERVAASSLSEAIRRVRDTLAALPDSGSLGTFGQSFRALLEPLHAPTRDRARVFDLLDAWGPAPSGAAQVGPTVGLRHAAEVFRNDARQAQALDGSVGDPAVVVAPPMTLFGGTFDAVFVLGLSHGRFPRVAKEDPLIPDTLIGAVRARCGQPRMLLSSDLADAERRRLAAALSSASQRVFLSAPRADLMSAKPILPSSLVLEIASVLLGRRASYADLEPTAGLFVRAGSRAWPGPRDPDAAANRWERLLALAQSEPETVLRTLNADARTQPLVHLTAEVAAVHGRAEMDALAAGTGRILADAFPADALPAADRLLSAGAMLRLIAEPRAYLWRDVLRAWPAPSLRAPAHPAVAYRVRGFTTAALGCVAGTQDPLAPAATNAVQEATAFDTSIAESARELAVELAVEQGSFVLNELPEWRIATRLEQPETGRAVDDGGDWRIADVDGWTTGGQLIGPPSRGNKSVGLPADRGLALSAAALQASGTPVTHVLSPRLDKRCVAAAKNPAELIACLTAEIATARARVADGLYPAMAGDRVAQSLAIGAESERLLSPEQFAAPKGDA